MPPPPGCAPLCSVACVRTLGGKERRHPAGGNATSICRGQPLGIIFQLFEGHRTRPSRGMTTLRRASGCQGPPCRFLTPASFNARAILGYEYPASHRGSMCALSDSANSWLAWFCLSTRRCSALVSGRGPAGSLGWASRTSPSSAASSINRSTEAGWGLVIVSSLGNSCDSQRRKGGITRTSPRVALGRGCRKPLVGLGDTVGIA